MNTVHTAIRQVKSLSRDDGIDVIRRAHLDRIQAAEQQARADDLLDALTAAIETDPAELRRLLLTVIAGPATRRDRA